ncbi:low affinity immunoglobulin gamma Fc region receptor III-like isoform 3-T3 [Hipposideros larvatus]
MRQFPSSFLSSSPKPQGTEFQGWVDIEDQMLHSVHPGSQWLLPPLTVLLLLAATGRGAAALSKAVLSLEPPWINLLRGDSVTLSCQGHGNDSIRWFHNGNPILTQVQPSYRLQVSNNDSGDYQCQTGQTSLSDPVHLDVVSDWLLLQTPRLVFQVGEPIELRCHSWMNTPLYKIVFFRNGNSTGFHPQQSNFSIPHANASHSGSAVPAISLFLLPWPQIAFCLMMGLLFAVDTGLYFSAQRELGRSLRKGGDDRVTWSKSLQDK